MLVSIKSLFLKKYSFRSIMLFLSLLCAEVAELNTYFLKKVAEMTEGAPWCTVLIKMVRKLKLSRNGGLKERAEQLRNLY